MSSEQVAAASISFGTTLALVVSFTVNKSIGWAILHGMCSWGYVFYYGLFC